MTPVPLPSRIGPAAQIQELVALSYGLSPKCMKGASRIREQAWPRQVAMYLTRNLTNHSLPWIGKAFGNRDHTTVIHAIRQVEGRMKSDPLYLADVEALKDALTDIARRDV